MEDKTPQEFEAHLSKISMGLGKPEGSQVEQPLYLDEKKFKQIESELIKTAASDELNFKQIKSKLIQKGVIDEKTIESLGLASKFFVLDPLGMGMNLLDLINSNEQSERFVTGEHETSRDVSKLGSSGTDPANNRIGIGDSFSPLVTRSKINNEDIPKLVGPQGTNPAKIGGSFSPLVKRKRRKR